MSPLETFLSPRHTSLKICGITLPSDAVGLVSLGVPALGANFWPQSRRYLPPENATFLAGLSGKILRVGVFVNEPPENILAIYNSNLIDLIQLHGDESPADAAFLREASIPFIKAIGVKTRDDLHRAADYGARAILLDAHAPGIYGGTGETFDWNVAIDFKKQHPSLPIILAGGITPTNAAAATSTVHPAALDIASGAEHTPGVKDFTKVTALLNALEG